MKNSHHFNFNLFHCRILNIITEHPTGGTDLHQDFITLRTIYLFLSSSIYQLALPAVHYAEEVYITQQMVNYILGSKKKMALYQTLKHYIK